MRSEEEMVDIEQLYDDHEVWGKICLDAYIEDNINFSRIPFISANKQIEHYQLGFNGIFFIVRSMKITEYNLKLRSSDHKE